jgi:SHS2 domain-containing protein
MTVVGRWHEIVAHTADVGMRGAADDPSALLDEAAVALAEISATIVGEPASGAAVPVEARGGDVAALVYDWLNVLIAVAEERGEALVGTDCHAEPVPDGWRARGRAWFAPYDGVAVRPRLQVKAATFHGLRVDEEDGRWRLQAYLDV